MNEAQRYLIDNGLGDLVLSKKQDRLTIYASDAINNFHLIQSNQTKQQIGTNAKIAELKELVTWAKKQVDKYLVEYDEREVQIAELKERIVLEKASHAQTYEFLSNVGADAIEKMVDDFVNRNIFCPVITRKAMKQYAQQLREQDNG